MKLKQSHKTALLWISLLLIFAGIFNTINNKKETTVKTSFSQFISDLETGKIKEITFKGKQTILGKYTATYKDGKKFETTGSTGSEIFKLIRSYNITPNYEEEEKAPLWQKILLNWGPMILIFVLFMAFMKKIQSGNGKAFTFGKSRAKIINNKTITFKDVAGIKEAKEDLAEFVDFLKTPKKYQKLGARIPKGVLLVGAPGTGKTLLAKAVSGEANVPFFSISGSDFVEMFVGVGASRVRDLFLQAKKAAPCIIFIDEIDAVGRQRGTGVGGGHDEREQTLNQLLVEMDGFAVNEGIVLIAATNRPDVLDPALLRPGRFDRQVLVNVPDIQGREDILKVHLRKVTAAKDIDLNIIARGTPGFTGADLENIVNEAAIIAAGENDSAVRMRHMDMAKDKVIMGKPRKSMILNDEDKKTIAIHESGHTAIAKLLKEADPIHKVTIIPHGMALGITQSLPEKEQVLVSKEKIFANIKVLMGGRVAEEVFLNTITTGASNDIERATSIARKMICVWGMNEKLGPLKWSSEHGNVFLGKDMLSSKDHSEETAHIIDEEMTLIVMSAYKEVKDLFLKNKKGIQALADELLKKETLEGKEIDKILEKNGFKVLNKFVPLKKKKLISKTTTETKVKSKPKTKILKSSSAKTKKNIKNKKA